MNPHARYRLLALAGIPALAPVVDDETRALVAALDVFENRDYYNVRNPKGSVGGGRFRKILDQIIERLGAWEKGEGPDDPFEGFDREQLRIAAKDRGVPLRRGAPREEIAAALLDDLRAKSRTERDKDKDAPEKPNKPEAPATKAPTRAERLLALEVAQLAKDGPAARSLMVATAMKKSEPQIQSAGRLLGVDVSGLDKKAAVERLADHALATRPDPDSLHPGADPAEVLAERISAAGSKSEMLDLMKGSNAAQLRKVAKETGVALRPGDRDSASISEHIAQSLSSYLMSDPRGGQGLGTLKSATPHPVLDPPETVAARERQAKIDKARGVAEALSELDELHHNGASAKAMEHRLRSSAKRNNLPPDMAEALVQAGTSGDKATVDALVDRLAKEHGLTRVGGPAGALEPFDRTKHQPVGKPIPDGAMVRVLRSGHAADVDGERVRLSKADVSEATPDEAAEVKAKAAAKVAAVKKAAPAKARQAKTGLTIHDFMSGLTMYGPDSSPSLRFGLQLEGDPKRGVSPIPPAQVAANIEAWARGPNGPLDWADRVAAGELVTTTALGDTVPAIPYDPRFDNKATQIQEERILREQAERWLEVARRLRAHAPASAKKAAPKLTPADIVADPNLTPAQKRARLRSRGLSKAEIDALVPLPGRTKAPKGPRPSGLPTDRKHVTGDYEDLAERITGKSEARILEIIGDLNASELARLARQFPGATMTVPGWNKTSDRRRGLQLPTGLSLDEQRKWLAKHLAGGPDFSWR